MNEQKPFANQIAIAQFRFALIAPVVQGLFPDPSKNAYFKRVTQDPLTLPDGSTFHYDYKSLSRWYHSYQKGGFDALIPKGRSDKGATRSLSDTAIEEIYRLKEKYPKLNATQIHIRLIQQSFIPATVSVCAVQRFIKKNDLKLATSIDSKDRKAFEEDSFGKMWQADTCHFPYISEDGQRRKVYCMMIIDDHSRMLVGGALFYNDNALCFQRVLKHAVASYGIPFKLYVDHGSPYANEQLALICGSLGISLIHAPVRDGAAKAKVERHFRSMKERWLYGLDLAKISSLAAFNQLLADYMRTYNTTLHAGIKQTPFDRFQLTRDKIRSPKSREWMEECFLNRIFRKVRKDSTISIDKKSYDAPMQFISLTVEIRYLPDSMEDAFILYEGKQYPIHLTDKVANCYTKRQKPAIDYSKAGGDN